MISIVENRDCMEAMKEFPDKFFDLAIVDPPYGIDINKSGRLVSEKGWDYKDWDKQVPDSQYFLELKRVSQNQIIWGGNYFDLPPTRCFLIWDKQQPEGVSFASCELAWTSFDSSAKTFYQRPQGEARIHPTQKPIALYKWLLSNYATCKHCQNTGIVYEDVAGDGLGRMAVNCEACDCAEKGPPKIIDTHLGSGSSRIAADSMGFDFWGYELDKEYFDASCKRFEQYKAQLNLF